MKKILLSLILLLYGFSVYAAGPIAVTQVGNVTTGNNVKWLGTNLIGNTIITTVSSSSTPALIATNGLQVITLSANATPTIANIAAGQRVTFEICQPATGGPYTWTWPTAVHGGLTIGTIANTCSIQSFNSFSGSTLVAESTGVINVAP